MKKFRVFFSYEASAYVDVEAENEEQAEDIVIFGNYDDDPEIYDGSSNIIDGIEEIKEDK